MCCILCRRCRVCGVAKIHNTPLKTHNDIQNWQSDQSSKRVKAAAIIQMVVNIVTEQKFVMCLIVLDDGSIMRAYLCHPKSENKNDECKSP